MERSPRGGSPRPSEASTAYRSGLAVQQGLAMLSRLRSRPPAPHALKGPVPPLCTACGPHPGVEGIRLGGWPLPAGWASRVGVPRMPRRQYRQHRTGLVVWEPLRGSRWEDR